MVKKKTHKEFTDEVLSKYGDEYLFLSEYENGSKEIKVKHKICGFEWAPIASNLLRGSSKCPRCSGKKKMTAEEFRAYINEETKGEFSVIGEFKGINYPIEFRHNTYGYTFSIHPYQAKKGEIGCRKCSNMLIHDRERVALLLEDKYGTEYILLSKEVRNNRSEIEVIHSVCKKSFKTNSTSIINAGKGCTHCNTNSSKGELKIEEFLKATNIKYNREFTFDDCRYKSLLFFDFAIFDSSGDLVGLIEFDGKQHFEPIDFFGGEEGFRLTQLKDSIKNEYCEANGIPLLRIPYWNEDNLKSILESYLSDIINNCCKEGA